MFSHPTRFTTCRLAQLVGSPAAEPRIGCSWSSDRDNGLGRGSVTYSQPNIYHGLGCESAVHGSPIMTLVVDPLFLTAQSWRSHLRTGCSWLANRDGLGYGSAVSDSSVVAFSIANRLLLARQSRWSRSWIGCSWLGNHDNGLGCESVPVGMVLEDCRHASLAGDPRPLLGMLDPRYRRGSRRRYRSRRRRVGSRSP